MGLLLPRLPRHRLGPVLGRGAGWLSDTVEVARTPDWRLLGAIGYLVFDIAVLWACLRAVGTAPPLLALVLGYQIGYLANLVPIPGGLGVLEGGLLGALLLYGLPAAPTAAAVVLYHAIALWVPAVGGDGRIRATAPDRRATGRASRAHARSRQPSPSGRRTAGGRRPRRVVGRPASGRQRVRRRLARGRARRVNRRLGHDGRPDPDLARPTAARPGHDRDRDQQRPPSRSGPRSRAWRAPMIADQDRHAERGADWPRHPEHGGAGGEAAPAAAVRWRRPTGSGARARRPAPVSSWAGSRTPA